MLLLEPKLLSDDSVSGALSSAGTAAHANAGIDLVVGLAHADSVCGALSSAGATGHASVGNNVCHDVTSICIFSLGAITVPNCTTFCTKINGIFS